MGIGRARTLASLCAALASFLVGCTDASDDPAIDPEPEPTGDIGPCDPTVEAVCGLPFPSDRWTVEDPATATGLRLALSEEALPIEVMRADVYERHDGFSPASALVVDLPGATSTGLPSSKAIADSLEPTSPTVIVDTTSGERVPHWAELDLAAPEGERALILRPAVGLQPGRRYVVALRGVVDDAGAAVVASPAFVELRDGLTATSPYVTERRPAFERMFEDLEAADVARDELQLAWDFTVMSQAMMQDDLLAMRADAAAWYATEGGGYSITAIDAESEEPADVALYVEGTIEVPLYLDTSEPGGVLARDEDGHPVRASMHSFPFWMVIPNAAEQAPPGILQYGHGMLGSGQDVRWDAGALAFAKAENYVLFGMDWTGFSDRDRDQLQATVLTGKMHEFVSVTEGLHQAMVNFDVGLRTVRDHVLADPALKLRDEGPAVDVERLHYFGNSQGGIMGGSYMALTTAIDRGVLAVPGQNYGLMIPRSVNFDPFATILRPKLEDARGLPLLLSLTQLLWDHVEPSGFSRHIRDPLPDTPAHDVLLLVAVGDHQVPTLAAHLLARSIGDVPSIDPVREIWGIEGIEGEHTGSAMIEVDFGDSPEPEGNLPASEGEDPHGRLAEVTPLFTTVARFFQTGVIRNDCDGPCDPM